MKKVVQDLTSGGIDWQREKWQSGLGSKFIHQGEKNAVKYADEVIVLSKGVQDYFKETYGRKTHFIPNGVNRPQTREANLITDKVSSFFRKLFLLVFVTSMILFRTLLNRDLWMNPLSDVMGGWGIWETVNGERQLTTECIENVILMMPFTGMVMWTFDVEKGVVWKSTKLGLIFSVSIEMLQLLLRLGTFQVSDIVYNTLGGMLGGLCYIVGKKVHERLSK